MAAFSWRCPFCQHDTTITDSNNAAFLNMFDKNNRHGQQAVWCQAVVCPNPKCREYSFRVAINDNASNGPMRHEWQLVPPAQMKVLPDYIPAPIVSDYREACLIASLSPKASATLARRCLQGMIRDFWGISKSRLVDEVEAIRERGDPLTWDAIEAVRKIGNVGAHMEKDINVIVDVEPEEARLLLGLIAMLVDDWYVNRHERQKRLTRLVSAAEGKAGKRPAADDTTQIEMEIAVSATSSGGGAGKLTSTAS